jgi:HK97 family phage prohead protease
MADTHPSDHSGNAETLHQYWVHGEGAAKIRWGTSGDFDRCVRQLEEHAQMTPDQAKGYCNLAHHAATGMYPATHAAMEKGHGRSNTPMPYTRSFPLEDISIARDGSGRVVDAYAAVFNTPAKVHDIDGTYMEVIDPAAFNRTLEHARRAKGGTAFPVLFNHGMTLYGTPSERYAVPIGVSEDVRVDGNGLFTRSRFHRTQAADEILEAIKDGSITAYSFQGDFLRSEPLVPRGGFRQGRDGKFPQVRRTESSLREYGPGTFAVYKDAAIMGIRAEQIAAIARGGFTRDQAMRFIDAMYESGTPLDPPDDGTPDDSGPATEEDPSRLRHSPRPPHLELQTQRAKFLIKHGGGRIGA